jgi:5'-nucleotidase
MKFSSKLALTLAATASMFVVVGCANKDKKPAAAAGSVDEIRATNVVPAPPPMPVQPVQPQPVQPVINDASPVVTQASLGNGATPAISGNTYTVQKGDTLFKIARAKYNDPSAVRKIKDANPGLDADHIRVGQKINLP